jgi:serine/threonine protein kinase
MKVFIKPGGREIELNKRNYLASGGQGEVYVEGDRAYKVYHDPANMIPQGKMQALAAISNPNVIKPEHTLVSKNGQPVGYDMRFIKDAWTACQLFPQAFRSRNGFTPDKATKLVEDLRGLVSDVHKAGVLIVDLNEMNLLVAKDFSEVYGIDADSYQTKGYPATVIMPSVMDPKVKHNDFTEMSDWFSFGIVAFQLFVGIHPFKGKHPSIKGLPERMEAGVSVFNPDVRVPKAVLPFDVIPKSYRAWFEQVFEKGQRLAPPGSVSGSPILVVPVVRTIGGTSNLDITKLWSFPSALLGVWESMGVQASVTDTGWWLGHQRVLDPLPGDILGVTFTKRANNPWAVTVDGSKVRLRSYKPLRANETVEVPLEFEQVMFTDGRAYGKLGGGIYEVTITEAGSNVIPSTRKAANCMEKATKLYEGVAIQNMLGEAHVTLFPGEGLSQTTPVPELKGYTVVDARCQKNVLMVIGATKNGTYDRLVLRFSTDRTKYDVRTVKDITPSGLNFTVLDTGVAACITEDEKLELFAVTRGSTGVKVIEDKVLGGDMTLGTLGGKVVFWRGDDLYRMSTK